MFVFIGYFTQTAFFCSIKYLLLQSCLKLFDLLGMHIILLNLLLQSCFQVLDLLSMRIVLLNLFFIMASILLVCRSSSNVSFTSLDRRELFSALAISLIRLAAARAFCMARDGTGICDCRLAA